MLSNSFRRAVVGLHDLCVYALGLLMYGLSRITHVYFLSPLYRDNTIKRGIIFVCAKI
jgi:hypothetical protein